MGQEPCCISEALLPVGSGLSVESVHRSIWYTTVEPCRAQQANLSLYSLPPLWHEERHQN